MDFTNNTFIFQQLIYVYLTIKNNKQLQIVLVRVLNSHFVFYSQWWILFGFISNFTLFPFKFKDNLCFEKNCSLKNLVVRKFI